MGTNRSSCEVSAAKCFVLAASEGSMIVAAHNRGLVKPGGIENCASFTAKVRESAGTQTDARQFVTLLLQSSAGGNGMMNAREGVVRIDEKNAIVRQRIRISVECVGF